MTRGKWRLSRRLLFGAGALAAGEAVAQQATGLRIGGEASLDRRPGGASLLIFDTAGLAALARIPHSVAVIETLAFAKIAIDVALRREQREPYAFNGDAAVRI